jgi:HlyD family secretion protein
MSQASAFPTARPAARPPAAPTGGAAEPPLRTEISAAGLAGLLASLALLVLIGLWAAFTPIAGAVIAQGEVIVRGQPKHVQSLDGGIVAEIHTADGARVTAGEVLIRLDPTLLQANLDIARTRLAEALTRRARLESEQAGAGTVDFAPIAATAATYLDGMDLSTQEEGQRQILAARRAVLEGKVEQMAERSRQFQNQAEGVKGLIAAKEEQLSYLDRQLDSLMQLNKSGLARESQVLDVQRGRSELLGQIAEYQAELARLANSVRDTELEGLQADREFREGVVTDLRKAISDSEELMLQILTTRAQIARVDIRAPASGIVHELQATTLGGVVAPGATILQVVPVGDGVEFELKLDTRAIDQVFVGQRAKVVLPAFDSRLTPNIFGEVAAISPTSVTDPATRQSFYRLRLDVPPEEIARLGAVELVPGMPVQAFLETGDRSALSYLLKPLTDHLGRAFREE